MRVCRSDSFTGSTTIYSKVMRNFHEKGWNLFCLFAHLTNVKNEYSLADNRPVKINVFFEEICDVECCHKSSREEGGSAHLCNEYWSWQTEPGQAGREL
jgi:hypothetical protein